MTDRLFVFAITAKGDLRHTHLTRAQGMAAALPPLNDWLGATVDTDAIELFPVKDLGDLTLSNYIQLAFAAETIPPRDAQRIDAIRGSVLLVPDYALSHDPIPVSQVALIARLPLHGADHRAQLPKADLAPPARPRVTTQMPKAATRDSFLWGLAAVLAALAFIWLLVL